MTPDAPSPAPAARPLPRLRLARFRPRLLDTLPGYTRQQALGDLGAGLTVGVMALPLALAFAIASGVSPQAGLFTAIVGGLLISALGGSNVQVGGPAGAFIVIVYGIVERYGLANLLVSTLLAGGLMVLMGLLRLGGLVRYVPISIVIGFTNGIAVLIALSQLKDLLGLDLGRLPADAFSQLRALAGGLGDTDPSTLALGLACLGLIVGWPRMVGLARRAQPTLGSGLGLVPAQMVALLLGSLAAAGLALPVETIGSRFGGIPDHLPTLQWPALSWAGARDLVIPTLTLALLGAVEALLCARIADQLAPELPRHDPNQELMAQGVANMVVPLVGGIPATGTIARTMTNVRAGATTPVAGIVHALALLLVVLVAAPLAEDVPLAVLAAITFMTAVRLGEWHEFARLRQFAPGYRVILLSTFVLTVVFDLMVAVEVGLVLACVFFIWRMAALFEVQLAPEPAPGVALRRLYGALFFGASGKLEDLPEQLPPGCRVLVLDLQRLIALDSSGLAVLVQLGRDLARRGIALWLVEAHPQPALLMQRGGLLDELGPERLQADLAAVLARLDEPLPGATPPRSTGP
ncbi:STAS domain-containing protein [Piscinibacter sp. Jin2]|uniref:STAS domain-containing protein n=1 Tax=Aquariibacter lacus TaxID=2801332 RepID=A0A9X0XH01_9BURK|nr:SulP family inorganic anion transporter [Piscinibacter lacus]MBL0720761.1 STAS domain-containing protein [Piscinibacter lacus]